jgi:hypothetical protein
MKSFILFLFAVFSFGQITFSQEEYAGNWQGTLRIQNTELRLVLRVISEGFSQGFS